MAEKNLKITLVIILIGVQCQAQSSRRGYGSHQNAQDCYHAHNVFTREALLEGWIYAESRRSIKRVYGLLLSLALPIETNFLYLAIASQPLLTSSLRKISVSE